MRLVIGSEQFELDLSAEEMRWLRIQSPEDLHAFLETVTNQPVKLPIGFAKVEKKEEVKK